MSRIRSRTDTKETAKAHGNNARLRIAFCGYEGEHEFPDSWTCHAWKTKGGYGAGRPPAWQRQPARRAHLVFTSLFGSGLMSCISTLRIGCGAASLVRRWQTYLSGQGFYLWVVDGAFGRLTDEATKAFQYAVQLRADGVVGDKTFGLAMGLGFEVISARPPRRRCVAGPSKESARDPEWPPKPEGFDSPPSAQREREFGRFAHEPAPTTDSPEAIRITDGWATENIVRVTVPQLVGIQGAGRLGRIYVHRAIERRLPDLFAEWERAGLLNRVLSWDGSYVPRYVRGSRLRLSNHSFGTAFDMTPGGIGLGQGPRTWVTWARSESSSLSLRTTVSSGAGRTAGGVTGCILRRWPV